MKPHRIVCKALNVRTESKVCPGLAKTEEGETFVLDARTPGPRGICAQALTAMNSMRLALSVTGPEDLDGAESLDVVCPHGAVTYRLTREL